MNTPPKKRTFDSSGWVHPPRPKADARVMAEALRASAERTSLRKASERQQQRDAEIAAEYPALFASAQRYFGNKLAARATKDKRFRRRRPTALEPADEQRIHGLPPVTFETPEERKRWGDEMVRRAHEEEGARLSPEVWSRLLCNGLWSGFLEQMP